MTPFFWFAGPLVLGFLLDQLLGDPQWFPHPIRLIGWFISRMENLLRRLFPSDEKGLLWAGRVLAVTVPVVSWGVSAGILGLCGLVSPWLAFLVETVMCWQILALRSLRTESMAVWRKAREDDLEGARWAVSRIVGRDTQNLTMEGVVKAAVETVAENTSDGVIAPMIFMAIGGAPLGFFYKGVNTMDSMVGYKNDRYLFFGRAAAHLDDLCNWIPAQLSAWLMIAAAGICGFSLSGAAKIWKRDCRNHASPNSAHTEAACAGALGVQLAGDAWYFGKLHRKPTIGDPLRPVEKEDIPRANRLAFGTAALCLLLCLAVQWVILG